MPKWLHYWWVTMNHRRHLLHLGLGFLIGMILWLWLLALTGCALRPLKPGGAQATFSRTNALVTLSQPQNPKDKATQEFSETIRESVYSLPEDPPVIGTNYLDPAPRQPILRRDYAIDRRVSTTVGAAQKDVAREIAARFAGMRPIQIVGVIIILAGAVFLYYGWWSPGIIAIATGAALVAFASLFAANPALAGVILLGGAALVLLVFWAYQSGQVQKAKSPKQAAENKPKPDHNQPEDSTDGAS